MQIGEGVNVAEAFMQESLSDLDTAKILYDKEKYSHAIYHMQQSFEKSIKSLYCYSRIKYDKNSEQDAYSQARKYGHNTKKSTLDLLVNISYIHEKFLLSSLPPDILRDPRYIKRAGFWNIYRWRKRRFYSYWSKGTIVWLVYILISIYYYILAYTVSYTWYINIQRYRLFRWRLHFSS